MDSDRKQLCISRLAMSLCMPISTILLIHPMSKNGQLVCPLILINHFLTQALTFFKALMIHGGGHVMFTRKEVNPKQTKLLLENGFRSETVVYKQVGNVSLYADIYYPSDTSHVKKRPVGMSFDIDKSLSNASANFF